MTHSIFLSFNFPTQKNLALPAPEVSWDIKMTIGMEAFKKIINTKNEKVRISLATYF